MGFIVAGSLLALIYLLLQLYYIYYWRTTPRIDVPVSFRPSTGITVVVIARNEEKSIAGCINSILAQNYPVELFELIVIDDRSTDAIASIVKEITNRQIKFLRLADFPEFIYSPAYKKSGIEIGVSQSKFDLIVVTDADCTHPSEWLRTLAFAQDLSNAVFMTAPVIINDENSLLVKMQQMENHALMLVTAAGIKSGLHDIANGANMAFSKAAFQEVGGYKGNYQYPSGDDMFLIEKMRKHSPERIAFVKSPDACAYTSGKTSWESMMKQRLRWAGKNKALGNPLINMIWLFIGAYNIAMFLLLIVAFFYSSAWLALGIVVFVKWFIDFVALIQMSAFFKTRFQLSELIILQGMYTMYILRLGWNMILGKKGDW